MNKPNRIIPPSPQPRGRQVQQGLQQELLRLGIKKEALIAMLEELEQEDSHA